MNLVNVDFSVRDAHDRPAGDLSKDDFEVLEDGVPLAHFVFTAAPPTLHRNARGERRGQGRAHAHRRQRRAAHRRTRRNARHNGRGR